MIEIIKNVITKYFDEQYLNDESYVNSPKIKEAIITLTKGKSDWEDRTIFEDLRNRFKDFKFENQTHFYCNDRCLKINAVKSGFEKIHSFSVCVSIFGFFFIYKRDYSITTEGKYILEPISFVEKGENSFTDEIFSVIQKYYLEIVWLPNEILFTPVYKLNIFSDNLRRDIMLVDLLFSQDR